MGTRLQQTALNRLRQDLGPVVVEALQAADTIEVACNPDGRVWVEKLGGAMEPVCQLEPARVESVLTTLASFLDRTVTKDAPVLEGELPPDGHRFLGLLPPVTLAASFSIRVPASRVIRLEEYVAAGILPKRLFDRVVEAIAKRRNVLVVGGTGSGKTTLVNALIAKMVEVTPHDRFIILEDTREIQCAAENTVQMRTAKRTTMSDLLRATLRMRPDRILVGEVRGPEALDLVMAWNTGHSGGAATVHANSAEAGLARMETLVSMNGNAPREIRGVVAEAVDLIVNIRRTPQGREINEVQQVMGCRDGQYELTQLS